MKLPNFGWITLRWMPITPRPDGHRDRLVRDHPDAAGEVVHLHREGRRRVERAVPGVLQRPGDPVRGLVDDLAGAVELLVGDAARGSSGRCRGSSARPARCSSCVPGSAAVDVLALGRQSRVVDAGERDVVGAGLQADLAQPVGIDHAGLAVCAPSASTFRTVGWSAIVGG